MVIPAAAVGSPTAAITANPTRAAMVRVAPVVLPPVTTVPPAKARAVVELEPAIADRMPEALPIPLPTAAAAAPAALMVWAVPSAAVLPPGPAAAPACWIPIPVDRVAVEVGPTAWLT